MDGKCRCRTLHIFFRSHVLKAFFASQEISMWFGFASRYNFIAETMSSHPPGMPTPNWTAAGFKKNAMTDDKVCGVRIRFLVFSGILLVYLKMFEL